jgi:thiol-disulfide isomerase/thioredoxin
MVDRSVALGKDGAACYKIDSRSAERTASHLMLRDRSLAARSTRLDITRTLLLCAALAACGKPARSAPITGTVAPATAAPPTQATRATAEREPDDGLVSLDGPELLQRIQKNAHKGVLVNAWASWCGSCKQELPLLIGLATALRAEGLDLMLVSVDDEKGRPAAVAALRELAGPPTSFIVRGRLGPFKRALNPDWKGAVPSTFLFDADAKLRYFWPGPVLEHEVAPIVEAFLAGQPLEGPVRVEHEPASP